jgi:hypothetical protein
VDISLSPADVRFTLKSDIALCDRHVRFVPIPDMTHIIFTSCASGH